MTLKSISDELMRAQVGKYALPLFDVSDTASAEGVFRALEDRCAPVMVAMYAPLIENAAGCAFAAYLHARAIDSPVPISLMLDHGGSFEVCIKALRLGFTDVMYDGSSLPIEENIAQARLVTRAAHAVGVKVEAELGHVGSGSSYQSFGAKRAGFTDPDEVELFAAETGVDFLAVAIGTAHGQYQGDPMLDLELLAEIHRRIDLPLALHGGSGLSVIQYQQAIAAGISKINIATDLYQTAGLNMIEASSAENASYFRLTQTAADSFFERSKFYLDIFGASGKAR
jgi:fructose-bisphosphate aldolase, class II